MRSAQDDKLKAIVGTSVDAALNSGRGCFVAFAEGNPEQKQDRRRKAGGD
jgi:hypothetical protein